MAAESVWRKWRREVRDILEVGNDPHIVGNALQRVEGRVSIA
jgi:hypothetical protein